MDFETQLAQYRQTFSQKENEVKMAQGGAPVESTGPEAIWADEIAMPQAGLNPMDPQLMGQDVEMPQVMYDRHQGWSEDEEANTEAFRQYFESDPMVQQFAPEMEALLEEIITRAQDPSDPLDEKEATKLFAEMMTEQFGQYFK